MVGECVSRYLDHARRYYVHADGSQTGEALTLVALLRPLTKRFDDLPARDLGPKKLKQVREDLIAAGYKPGPLFKEMLTAAEDAQLEGEVTTKTEALALLRERFG